jgi:hypothetical protein
MVYISLLVGSGSIFTNGVLTDFRASEVQKGIKRLQQTLRTSIRCSVACNEQLCAAVRSCDLESRYYLTPWITILSS